MLGFFCSQLHKHKFAIVVFPETIRRYGGMSLVLKLAGMGFCNKIHPPPPELRPQE